MLETEIAKLARMALEAAYRQGYRDAKVDAIDRCTIECPAQSAPAWEVVQQCIAAVAALDPRLAMIGANLFRHGQQADPEAPP